MSILAYIARITEPRRVWFQWNFVTAVLIILGHRENLRSANLIDTETAPPKPEPAEDPVNFRTADGSYNDLGKPWMGMAGSRFARNVALEAAFGETGDDLMTPSPREVSRRLLARREFTPVPHLNVLAAAWIQFMVHDWLSHGKNNSDHLHEIPLAGDDDWEGPMTVPATTLSAAGDADAGRPGAFTNVETHWWDGSQIYGSSEARIAAVRRGTGPEALPDGKLALDDRGLLPLDSPSCVPGLELSGVNGNWWIGLSVLHTLFVREHNAVVDRLKAEHPAASGDWLFGKARLVVSALLAKIHTVEWTPALMDSPVGRMAMRGNQWGIVGERETGAFGRMSMSEIINGIPGSPADHHGAPYAMTEEFTAVYRLHSLLPDSFDFRRARDDSHVQTADLAGVSAGAASGLYRDLSFDDVLYSLCTEHPGALVLHNYPEGLRHLKRENGHTIDLAAIDILRDRERGVPRFAEFRRQTGMSVPKTFSDITSNSTWAAELEDLYGTVDKVDLLVGTLAEAQSDRGQPPRFGFSDTAFRIFILMASRRLKSDRFFTDDFRPEIYTEAGFDWVKQNSLRTVVARHCPELAHAYGDARNMFFPWERSS
ncbi:peroxidase family protein [Alloyangia pacifica]|uniref:Animal haem peroxidase n=1 Tax=Alloyangia pacifica TaxID=311180 RepID=A0A1I6VUX0_9RHOB|nr:peroxidase family protein [Alloyangia pacifica]SDI24890.1 Animal haem peroxidase [Alloyangia pacifica]SFT17516.1 Animal haem peroxidase [Alloyangia pacifica]